MRAVTAALVTLLMLFPVLGSTVRAAEPGTGVSDDHPLFKVSVPDEEVRLEGRFKQEKMLEDLGATIESKGDFTFSVEEGLRWRVSQPVASELRITREEIVELQDGEEVMRIAIEQQPMTRVITEIFFSMFTGDRSALEQYFDLSGNGAADRWALHLDPLEESVASVITSIELMGSQQVEEMTLRETNGDVTRIHLEDVRLNKP